MSTYAEKIDAALTMEELENIIEEAADDTGITNEDYFAVYNHCVNRARDL